MQILISKKFKGRDAGRWVAVETGYLFNNQYNVKNERVMDSDVIAVRDDARIGMAKCTYCGALMKVEDIEKHYAEQESCKNCKACSYWKRTRLSSDTIRRAVKYEKGDDPDEIRETVTVQRVNKYTPAHCTYDGGCRYEQCRRYKAVPFTAENTYFIKHPLGKYKRPLEEWFESKFPWNHRKNWYVYTRKIGSYTLLVRLMDADTILVVLRNTRKMYTMEEHIKSMSYEFIMPGESVFYKVNSDTRSAVMGVVYGIRYYREYMKNYGVMLDAEEKRVNADK